jgi:hypothetical protein
MKYEDIKFDDPDRHAKQDALVTRDMHPMWWTLVAFLITICTAGAITAIWNIVNSASDFRPFAIVMVAGLLLAGLGQLARKVYTIYIYKKWPDLKPTKS